MVDYRDRISVALWVVMLGMASTLLLRMPSTTLVWIAFGTPLSVELSTNLLLGAMLVVLAAGGSHSVIRAHPLVRQGTVPGTWVMWALPAAIITVSALLLPVLPTRLLWLIGLAVTAVVLGTAYAATYHSIDSSLVGYRVARIVLALLTYATVLLLFLGVYSQRARSLYSATLVVGVSALLALELLRGTGRPLRQISLHALVVGLVLGQFTWALNYWSLSGLRGGLLLLLGFYLLVGISQQGLADRLSKRVFGEFVVVSAISLVLIWLFTP